MPEVGCGVARVRGWGWRVGNTLGSHDEGQRGWEGHVRSRAGGWGLQE